MAAGTQELRSELLANHHDREGFSCGDAALDHYLKQQARQDVKKRVAAAYVLTPDGKTIAGYYTLSQFSVELNDLPVEFVRKLPKYGAVPVTLIGRLARNMAFHGDGIGECLLFDALKQCLESSGRIASWAIIVDAANPKAEAFYRRYGFLALPLVSQRLFLPMKTVEQMNLL
jgi:predicted GNAT family N-acyltransferase